jgi:hypothetical protein
MNGIEAVAVEGNVLAYIIRSDAKPAATGFITGDESSFQAGFVVYPRGGEVQPHVHLPVERNVLGTAEFILVRSGRCLVDVYSDERAVIATRELGPGDAILTLAGGHGFRMTEDTVLLEVKQGPFMPGRDKERFERHTDLTDE